MNDRNVSLKEMCGKFICIFPLIITFLFPFLQLSYKFLKIKLVSKCQQKKKKKIFSSVLHLSFLGSKQNIWFAMNPEELSQSMLIEEIKLDR